MKIDIGPDITFCMHDHGFKEIIITMQIYVMHLMDAADKNIFMASQDKVLRP